MWDQRARQALPLPSQSSLLTWDFQDPRALVAIRTVLELRTALLPDILGLEKPQQVLSRVPTPWAVRVETEYTTSRRATLKLHIPCHGEPHLNDTYHVAVSRIQKYKHQTGPFSQIARKLPCSCRLRLCSWSGEYFQHYPSKM